MSRELLHNSGISSTKPRRCIFRVLHVPQDRNFPSQGLSAFSWGFLGARSSREGVCTCTAPSWAHFTLFRVPLVLQPHPSQAARAAPAPCHLANTLTSWAAPRKLWESSLPTSGACQGGSGILLGRLRAGREAAAATAAGQALGDAQAPVSRGEFLLQGGTKRTAAAGGCFDFAGGIDRAEAGWVSWAALQFCLPGGRANSRAQQVCSP